MVKGVIVGYVIFAFDENMYMECGQMSSGVGCRSRVRSDPGSRYPDSTIHQLFVGSGTWLWTVASHDSTQGDCSVWSFCVFG